MYAKRVRNTIKVDQAYLWWRFAWKSEELEYWRTSKINESDFFGEYGKKIHCKG